MLLISPKTARSHPFREIRRCARSNGAEIGEEGIVKDAKVVEGGGELGESWRKVLRAGSAERGGDRGEIGWSG
jgi:hypothetical protein